MAGAPEASRALTDAGEVAARAVSRPLVVARWLLVALVISLMFSPPVTNLLQAVLLVLIVASRELRARLWAVRQQPMVLGALAFLMVVLLGALYSAAPGGKIAEALVGWRKLLFVPIAAALIDDRHSRLQLLRAVVVAATACALVSFASVLADLPSLLPGRPTGVIVRNHATQGMLFAVAAFAAAALAMLASPAEPRRMAWGVAAALLTTNVLLVTPGRSGYVVLLVCAGLSGLVWVATRRAHRARAAVLAAGVMAAIGLTLVFAPAPRERIVEGLNEMRNFDRTPELTSMGVRVHFWRNTLTMIGQRPWLGTGTAGFEGAYNRMVEGRTGMAGTPSSDPHNQFMKIAAEHGLPGLAVFLAFLAACALGQRPEPLFRLMGIGVLLSWCGTSMASSHFSTFSEGYFIYIWVGAMLGAPAAACQAGGSG